MAMTKNEMKKVVMDKKRDLTKLILGISGAIFAVFIVFALLNLTNQVDWSMKQLPTTDLNRFTLNSDYGAYLNDGPVNVALRNAFRDHGHILTTTATIASQKDGSYLLRNDTKTFVLLRTNIGVTVQERVKGIDTNEDGRIDALDVFDGHDSTGNGVPDQGQSPTQRFLNFLFIGLGIMVGPYAFYASKKQNEIKEIEKRLPDFLRDVAEAGRFGMTLADAIVVASSGRYGVLTPEIKKMAAQIEWGVTAGETLRLFSERINTPLVRRVVTIVVKASDAGGSVADVLSMVAHDTKEEQYSQSERKLQMSTYLAVIYISFFVFLVTIIILNLTFLPKIRIAGTNVAAAAAEAGIEGGVGGASLDVSVIPAIQICFFLAVMAHAIGDGIMAGVLQTGSIADGMRHSVIMLAMGFLILTFM